MAGDDWSETGGQQTGDQALLGGSLRTEQRRGERSERFTGLHLFEHRPTLIYDMLRSSVTRHFSSHNAVFFSSSPDANRQKAEMSPLSLRYRAVPFYPIFLRHLLESPETFTRLHFISSFVSGNLNWNFFSFFALSPPCVEMPHKICYSSTAVLQVFFEERSLIIVSDRWINALSGFLCRLQVIEKTSASPWTSLWQ